jgi:hypothetical protein
MAILTALKLFTSTDPAFVGITDDELNDWIAKAVTEVDATAWGLMYADGVALLAAHMFSVTKGLGSAGLAGMGAAAARRARNWEVRMQATSGGTSSGNMSLDETSYGREYARKRRLLKGARYIIPNAVSGITLV